MNDKSESNLVSITPSRTDAELAAEIRTILDATLRPVVDVLNRAKDHGLEVAFSMSRDQTGRWFPPQISISKPL